MLVLAHCGPGLLMPFLALFAFLSPLFLAASAQTVINGQVFTKALTIIDSPQPGTPLHAGSSAQVAIDVSGSGRIGQLADTSFGFLELYLVSADTGTNITVAAGADVLGQESGSTVKHVNFDLPKCAPSGNYNLTVYETARIKGADFFSISAIAVTVLGGDAAACQLATNALQAQPQADSPPPRNPWNDRPNNVNQAVVTVDSTTGPPPATTTSSSAASPATTDAGAGQTTSRPDASTTSPTTSSAASGSASSQASSSSSTGGGTGVITLTVGPSGVVLPTSILTRTRTETETATHTASGSGATRTRTRTLTLDGQLQTVTVVFVSLRTETTTATDSRVQTTTVTALSTTTAVMDSAADHASFFPVSAAARTRPPAAVWAALALVACLAAAW